MCVRSLIAVAVLLGFAGAACPRAALASARVAYVCRRTVFVRDIRPDGMPLAGSRAVRVCRVPGRDKVGSIAISRDGRQIAVSTYWFNNRSGTGGCDLWLVPAAEHAAMRHLGKGGAPAFSPDGKYLAYETQGARWEQNVRVIDLARRTSRQLWAKGSSPCWSGDGREIALIDESSREFVAYVLVVDAKTAKVAFRRQGANAESPFLSPDGRYVAFNPHLSRPKLSPEIVNRVTGVSAAPNTGGVGEPVLGWSPDSRWLLWTRWQVNPNNDGCYLWIEVWASDASGRASRRICLGGPARFAPDSRHVLAVRCTKRDPDPPGDLIAVDLRGKRLGIVAENVLVVDVSGEHAPKRGSVFRVNRQTPPGVTGSM